MKYYTGVSIADFEQVNNFWVINAFFTFSYVSFFVFLFYFLLKYGFKHVYMMFITWFINLICTECDVMTFHLEKGNRLAQNHQGTY